LGLRETSQAKAEANSAAMACARWRLAAICICTMSTLMTAPYQANDTAALPPSELTMAMPRRRS
jgi:hypothetical protein